MNTKKVFFGLLAVSFLMMAVVATVPSGDELIKDTTKTSLKKSKIGKM
ncbi:MAG: hypothetical protein AAFU57_18390 [Bacteroidota bacterium]